MRKVTHLSRFLLLSAAAVFLVLRTLLFLFLLFLILFEWLLWLFLELIIVKTIQDIFLYSIHHIILQLFFQFLFLGLLLFLQLFVLQSLSLYLLQMLLIFSLEVLVSLWQLILSDLHKRLKLLSRLASCTLFIMIPILGLRTFFPDSEEAHFAINFSEAQIFSQLADLFLLLLLFHFLTFSFGFVSIIQRLQQQEILLLIRLLLTHSLLGYLLFLAGCPGFVSIFFGEGFKVTILSCVSLDDFLHVVIVILQFL